MPTISTQSATISNVSIGVKQAPTSDLSRLSRLRVHASRFHRLLNRRLFNNLYHFHHNLSINEIVNSFLQSFLPHKGKDRHTFHRLRIKANRLRPLHFHLAIGLTFYGNVLRRYLSAKDLLILLFLLMNKGTYHHYNRIYLRIPSKNIFSNSSNLHITR